MIEVVEGSVLEDLPDYSVILHQCNAKGWMGSGIASAIKQKWPQVFKEYHEYCGWFKDGHENEILGTFVGVKVSPKLIICNAIAQLTVGKNAQQTDYEAWDVICKKLEKQTRVVNEKTGVEWTLHAPEKIGCGLGGGEPEKMIEIFERWFGKSNVKLVLHRI